MQYSSAIFGVVLLAAVVSAEFGYYVPKAFYKIDENGYKSPLTYIDNLPPIFHRTRRAAQLGGVNFGFPIQFPSFPQIPAANSQGNFQGVQTSITSGGSNLDSRFDESGQSVQTTFTSFSNNNGHFLQTTHFVDKDGKVTTHKHESGKESNSNPHSNPHSDSHHSSPPSSSTTSSPTKKN